MLLNTPQNVWATCCARIPYVTWVQLCSRLQQATKHRVDQHPAVTAVPEKPRAPIQLSCGNALNGLRSFLFLQDILCTSNMANCSKHIQLAACETVSCESSPDCLARSQLYVLSSLRRLVTYELRHTYRSRWGRATCLSNWAQGLNMERLRAQAPWRSHTQTP